MTVQVTGVPGVTVVATVNFAPAILQTVPVTVYVTAPVPDPPVVVKVIPAVPFAPVNVALENDEGSLQA